MISNKKDLLGSRSEDLAVKFLEQYGYKIIQRNFRCKSGEIDIIAKDKGTLVFIEVKSRSSIRKSHPYEAINTVKQKRISRAAVEFAKDNRILDKKSRFDVISVIYSGGMPRLELLKNAFDVRGDFVY